MIRREEGLPPLRRQGGLSLIEVMISLTLGLIVTSALLYVFAGGRASYRHQESLSTVQETGRFALELLARDIRMAGYAGCRNLKHVDVEEQTKGVFSNLRALQGTGGVNAQTPDSVTIRRGAFGPALTAMPNTSQIQVDNARLLGEITTGGRMLVTDCKNLEVFTVDDVDVSSSTNSATITASQPLSQTFPVGSQVMRFEEVTYDVVAGNQLRQTRNGTAQIVADGVENLKIFYGEDTTEDRNADQYVGTPGNWARVVSARIELDVADTDITHRFSTTIVLRNRAP